MIYLDNAATTQIHPKVLKTMLPFLREQYGNAGTKYRLGRDAADGIRRAREHVAQFLNCEPEQIIFTSGGTEANNLALAGSYDHLVSIGKGTIMSSLEEHDSVLKTLDYLAEKRGATILYRHIHNDGIPTPESLQNVGLASFMYVNNETGDETDVETIGYYCRQLGVLFHTDCTQAAASKRLDVNQIGCDLLTISSHKIFGPKGIGALYVRDKSKLSPILHGGSGQEFGVRAGTENVAAILGFAEACDIIRYETDYTAAGKLMSHFLKHLHTILESKGLSDHMKINSDGCAQSIVNIGFEGIDAETLLYALDNRGVCVSAGAACSSGESKPSHVLLAKGISPELARSSIRISLSALSRFEDVMRAAEIIADTVESLYSINQ